MTVNSRFNEYQFYTEVTINVPILDAKFVQLGAYLDMEAFLTTKLFKKV